MRPKFFWGQPVKIELTSWVSLFISSCLQRAVALCSQCCPGVVAKGCQRVAAQHCLSEICPMKQTHTAWFRRRNLPIRASHNSTQVPAGSKRQEIGKISLSSLLIAALTNYASSCCVMFWIIACRIWYWPGLMHSNNFHNYHWLEFNSPTQAGIAWRPLSKFCAKAYFSGQAVGAVEGLAHSADSSPAGPHGNGWSQNEDRGLSGSISGGKVETGSV